MCAKSNLNYLYNKYSQRYKREKRGGEQKETKQISVKLHFILKKFRTKSVKDFFNTVQGTIGNERHVKMFEEIEEKIHR